MVFAEVRAEDWLWMTDYQKRGKSDKEPRTVGNTMGVGSKEEESKRKTPALKKEEIKDQAKNSTGCGH